MRTVAASYLPARPAVVLRPLIDDYLGYVERVDGVLRRREFAGDRVVLVLGLADPLEIADPRTGAVLRAPSFGTGLFDRYADTTTTGTGSGVQLTLPPLLAGRLFGVPMGELANQVRDVADLPGGWAAELAGRLAGAGGWDERFALIDNALVRRLARTEEPDSWVPWAWQRLVAARGLRRIDELAREVGVGRRQFTVRFQREIGLTPKTMARILRFKHASALAVGSGPGGGAASGGGWAGLASRCGYYDQAHLIRDFRQFAGATPTEMLAERAGTGQGALR